MKLVESDIQGHDEDDPITTAPRPEHRRVYTSLIFTFSVLTATVAAVYTLFPARDNELLTTAAEAHRSPGEWELTAPPAKELLAWGTGAVGPGVPFPSDGKILGAKAIRVLKHPVAMARYAVGSDEVSYFVLRTHEAFPLNQQRQDGDLQAISWRSGKWIIVVVGPAASRDSWAKPLGVP